MFRFSQKLTSTLGIGALAAMMGLSGCSSTTVMKDYDSQANFSVIKQVQWLPAQMATNPQIGQFRAEQSLSAVRVQKAIERVLAAKSFHWTQKNADAYVSFYVEEKRYYTADQPQFTIGLGMGHNVRFGGIWAEPPPEYMEKTTADLVIQILNPEANVIWEAKADFNLDNATTPQQKELQIFERVNKMLADFPPN